MKRTLALLGVLVVIGLVGLAGLAAGIAWGGKSNGWQVQTMRTDGADRMYRVHNDGRVEVMTPSGWKPATRSSKPSAIDPSTLPLMSCAEYATEKAKGPHATRNLDLFHRLPDNCP